MKPEIPQIPQIPMAWKNWNIFLTTVSRPHAIYRLKKTMV